MREELEILRSELYKSCSELYKIESNTITVEPDFTFESNIELKDTMKNISPLWTLSVKPIANVPIAPLILSSVKVRILLFN